MAVKGRRAPDRAARGGLITRTARRIAEQEGWDAVTTRRLAAEIDYSQPVLYSHFASMEDVVDAVALEGFAELASALRLAREAADPGDRLVAVAATYRAFAGDNPALYDAMFTRATRLRFGGGEGTPAPLTAAFAELSAAVRAAAPGEDVDTLTEVVWAALHGLAVLGGSQRLRPGLEGDRVRLTASVVASPAPAARRLDEERRPARDPDLQAIRLSSPSPSDLDATPAGRRPGRPPRISLDDVVDAARDVGLDGLTIRGVADRLGVTGPAIYHYVANAEQLGALVCDRVALEHPLPDAGDRPWSQWVLDAAWNLRAMLESTPGMASHAMRFPSQSPGILGLVEHSLSVARGSGFDPVRALWVTRAIANFVEGWVARAEAMAQVAASVGTAPRDSTRQAVLESEDFPHLHESLRASGPAAPEEEFAFTLQVLVDGATAQQGF